MRKLEDLEFQDSLFDLMNKFRTFSFILKQKEKKNSCRRIQREPYFAPNLLPCFFYFTIEVNSFSRFSLRDANCAEYFAPTLFFLLFLPLLFPIYTALQIYTVKLQWKRDTCKKCTLYKYLPYTVQCKSQKILKSRLASRIFSQKMNGRIWFVCREE